ncbi:DNA repair protein RecO [Halanaerobaculum tunisiense]
MSLFDTDAIVLRHYELGEADKIVILFTRAKGKIKVVANGIRKTKSTLAAGLEPFTYNHVVVYQGKSELARLSQCEIKESFSSLRDNIVKMGTASYLAELINELTVLYQANQDIFKLSVLTLQLLTQLEELDLLIRAFELKLLALLGYRPQLSNCIKCNSQLDEEIKFSLTEGSLVCASCASGEVRDISWGTVKFMQQLLQLDYRRLLRLQLPDYANQQLATIIPAYIEMIIEKRLKSLSFLQNLSDIQGGK